MKPIFGIDSETANDEDGRARCTLVALSNAEGKATYIQEENGKGIGSHKALHFVSRAGAKAELWTFFGDYDVNFWVRDFHPNALDRLRRQNWARWDRWRVHHIPRRIFEVWDLKSGHYARVYDVFPFIQTSFVAWLENWQLCDKRTLSRISSMKARRGEFARLDPNRILRYTLDEVRLIAKGVSLVKDRVRGAGLAPSMWMGPGSVAAKAMRMHEVQNFMPKRTHPLAERAYYGGRIETSAVGVVSPKSGLRQYDIVSAYPAACATLPCLRHGRWERTRHPRGPTLVYCRWKPRGNLPLVWGPFPVRPAPGVPLRYYAEGRGYYWWDEVEPWTRCQQLGLHLGVAYRWVQTCKHEPFAWVRELFDKRAALKAKGDPAEYALKLVLNSIYGKLAQRVGTARFYCPEWAGLITARTRGRLGQALISQSPGILVVATDGLLMADGDRIICERPGTLGAWTREADYDRADLWQPGFYVLSDGKLRTRGYSRIDVDEATLRSAWQQDGLTGSSLLRKQFIVGYRLATAQNRMVDYCRWVTDETDLSFNPLPRRYLGSWMEGGQAIHTVAPRSLAFERATGIPELRRTLGDYEEDGCPDGFARD